MGAIGEKAREAAISVEGVSKRFPKRRSVRELVRAPFRRGLGVHAVRGVSFGVGEGELVGLLGPNGAGKTTLLKMLCGLIMPDEGRVAAFGLSAGTQLSRLVGLVHGDERSFYWRLNARENLEFFARLHGLPRPARARRVEELLGKVELADDAERRFSDFSSGMRQRLAIARALLADPPALLMDEPTRSLDPVTAARLREWVREELHGRDGKSILLATHNLREAEQLCDRVVVMARGEVRADATPAELKRRGVGGVAYRLRVLGLEGAPLPGDLPGDLLEDEPAEAEGGRTLLVRLERHEELDALVGRLREAGARLADCAPETPELETIFHGLVGSREEQDAGGRAAGTSLGGEA